MTTKTTPDLDKYSPDDVTRKRMEKAFAQNAKSGGTIEIDYDGYVVLAPLGDILYNIHKLESYKPFQRIGVMKSVNKSIKDNFPKLKRHEVDTKRAVEIMQDIAIWYANEIIMGKAQLP